MTSLTCVRLVSGPDPPRKSGGEESSYSISVGDLPSRVAIRPSLTFDFWTSEYRTFRTLYVLHIYAPNKGTACQYDDSDSTMNWMKT